MTQFQEFYNSVAPHDAADMSDIVITPSFHAVRMWSGFGLENRLAFVNSRVVSARQSGDKQLINSRLSIADLLGASQFATHAELRKSCTIACVVDSAHRHGTTALLPHVDRYCVEPDDDDEVSFSIVISRFAQSLIHGFLS